MRPLSLFDFKYAIIASAIVFAGITAAVGRPGPAGTAAILVCVAIVVPVTGWVNYRRGLKQGRLKLDAGVVEAAGARSANTEKLAQDLKRFLFSPAFDANAVVYSFSRGHHLRAIPVCFGFIALIPPIVFLFSPVPWMSPMVTTIVLAAAIMVALFGLFWRTTFALHLKERTMTTRTIFGTRTDSVSAIGAEPSWVLGTRKDELVLDVRNALVTFSGGKIIRISDFEKPERPVFSAGEELANLAGVPFVRGPAKISENGTPVPADPEVRPDWWVISLPSALILTLIVLYALQTMRI